MRKAVFLDKDGTLVEDVPYSCDLERVRFLPGVMTGLRALQAADYLLIVVSNQAGVAHGFFSEEQLGRMEAHLRARLASEAVRLDGFFYCPHHPDARIVRYAVPCGCRKPACGLLRQAAAIHDVSLEDSWMIGDILHDVEAGHRAGCRAILLDNGDETEWRLAPARIPDYMVPTVEQAAALITNLDDDRHRLDRLEGPTTC